MFAPQLISFLQKFREDTRGTVMVETVMTLPILFWMMVATYDFFEVHRYKSVREKATYTIADTLSREQAPVNDTYVDNLKVLYDEMSNDDGINQLRVTVVQFIAADADAGTAAEYSVKWSEVRGTGRLVAYAEGTMPSGDTILPIMSNAEHIILVESVSTYDPLLDLVFSNDFEIETRVFNAIRFSPQLCFESCADT